MATVNLGLIKFRWQGAYAGGTAYVKDDVVSYNGSSYVCILASTGNLPTNTTYWNVMAQGGTDITSLAGLTQGDILYYNGTDWVRLGAGTSGQFLKTQGASANPVWADNTAGLVQTVTAKTTSAVTVSSSSFTATGLSLNITPSSSSNKIFITACGSQDTQANSRQSYVTLYRGSTNLGGSGGIINNYGSGVRIISGFNVAVLDSPNTTSQITYEVYMKSNDGNNVVLSDQGDHAFITAMEVSV